jgi:hypothetical protein
MRRTQLSAMLLSGRLVGLLVGLVFTGWACSSAAPELTLPTTPGACAGGCGPFQACTEGTCSCEAGFGDCDGQKRNGCETALNTIADCGACGVLCGATNAAGSCATGRCELRCDAGFSDCDASMANGCETPYASCSDRPGGGCAPESGEAMCARLGKTCGALVAVDNCGTTRQVECGTCPDGETCGLLVANLCAPTGCRAESDAALCARLGKNCGKVTGTDNCGRSRSVDCGQCIGTDTCGASTANVCGSGACLPEDDATFCERHGAVCGDVTALDNCRQLRTRTCGTCNGGETCGLYTANRCADPLCDAETDPELCQADGADCGRITVLDRCGARRSPSCGSCASGQTCGATVANQCGTIACTPETNYSFCNRLGKSCGSVTAYDNCFSARTVDCGTCVGATCGEELPNVCPTGRTITLGPSCAGCNGECLELGNGYCSVDCASDADCPSGGSCVEPSFYALPKSCFVRCTSGVQCPVGTSCRSIGAGVRACF